jgi:hypothetical protein
MNVELGERERGRGEGEMRESWERGREAEARGR